MDRTLTDFAYPDPYGTFIPSGESSKSRQTPSQTAKELAEIQENVQLFANNVDILQRKSEYLDTTRETYQLWDEIIQLTADTVELAQIPNASIQRVRLQTKKMSVRDRSKFEQLMSTYATSGVRFKNLRRMTLDLEQKRLAARQRQPPVSELSSESCDETQRSPRDEVGYMHKRRCASWTEEALIQDAEETAQSIQQLEQDIRDINEIFRDLGAMIQEQEEDVNRIEASVHVSTARAKHGNTQLEKAARAKRCSRKLKVAIVIVVAVIILAIVTGVVALLGVIKVYTVSR